MTSPAIQVSNLVKNYGSFRALDAFNLTVEPGTVAGFLGPNGAGKSTTIRVLLGLLRSDSGTATVLGLDPWRDAVDLHRKIAYVPGDTNLWPALTGGEIIDVLTRLRGPADTAQRRRRDELIERFELDPTKRARTYSKGNRQKVALVAALSSPAELFLLDEPTSGLDPLMEAVFTDEVRALRDEGRTVLLSSHILSEVEKLCDRVTIIRAGTDVESGTLEELRHLTRSHVTAHIDPTRDLEPLTSRTEVHDLRRAGETVRFTLDETQVVATLPILHQLEVTHLTIEPPSLEELFLRHYGDHVDSEGDVQQPSDGAGSPSTSMTSA